MSRKDIDFDLSQALEDLKAEQEQHIAGDEQPNRKNGYTSKSVKSSSGSFELDTPRHQIVLAPSIPSSSRRIRPI